MPDSKFNQLSRATHGISKVGDFETSWFLGLLFLSGLAVAIFVLAWVWLGKKPKRK